MGHSFSPKVSITTTQGEHIRYVPAALAGLLVQAGTAEPRPTSGRVKAVALVQCAATHAERIGEPSATSSVAVRFTRWVRLDVSASRVCEHHPRCLY